jgi:hypothetical protein
MATSEEWRPEYRRTDRPRRLRVARACRLEEVRLVPEAEQPVVVAELHVAIEREGTQICEIVEAVALQPCPERQLCRDAGTEQHRKR